MFRAYINEMNGSRSKVPSKISSGSVARRDLIPALIVNRCCETEQSFKSARFYKPNINCAYRDVMQKGKALKHVS
jgi:hypothetical protein